MLTDTEIANLTLSHLGDGTEIADLSTERNKYARAIRAFWKIAYKKALRDFPWPFATKFADLGPVEEYPTDEWGYSYRYPADCRYFRRILSGNRVDAVPDRVPYRVASDDDGKLIYTDQAEAQCEYTRDVDDTTLWSEDFVLAHSYLLAHYAAPRILGGDTGKVGQKMMELYLFEISKARANALNEESPDPDPDPELIGARN